MSDVEGRTVTDCALCRRRAAVAVPVQRGAICVSCLERIGAFFREGAHAVCDRIWVASRGAAIDRMVRAELTALKRTPAEYDADEVFASFRAQLAGKVTDPQTHLDLAIAYREMGLIDEMLGEAAIALSRAAALPPPRQALAVGLLLAPNRLRLPLSDCFDLLRDALFPA